jgi:peroxiredoxin
MHDAKSQRWWLPTIRILCAILVLSGLPLCTTGRLVAQEEKDAPEEKVAPEKKASDVPATQRDPLKQLSRQYARRKSAKNRDDHRPPTPPSAEEIREPVLAFSQGHRETCLAFAGDAMPDATLLDGDGKSHVLRDSLGKRLTVVIFWNADNPYALDQFQEIRRDVLPLVEQDVQAIAIHVGTPPEDYAELCHDSGQGVLCLIDADRAYFGQLATRMLPRTYVVDAAGKILWLDVEYSRSTRYDLRNALHFYLQK